MTPFKLEVNDSDDVEVWINDAQLISVAVFNGFDCSVAALSVDQAKEVIAALQSAVGQALKGELAQVAIAGK